MQDVLAELNDILGPGAQPAAARTEAACPQAVATLQEYRVLFVPNRDLLRQGMDPLLLLRDLSELGEIVEVRADLSRLPRLSDLDPESCYLGWTLRLRSTHTLAQVSDVFLFVQDTSRVAIEILTDAVPAAQPHPPRPFPKVNRRRSCGTSPWRLPAS